MDAGQLLHGTRIKFKASIKKLRIVGVLYFELTSYHTGDVDVFQFKEICVQSSPVKWLNDIVG